MKYKSLKIYNYTKADKHKRVVNMDHGKENGYLRLILYTFIMTAHEGNENRYFPRVQSLSVLLHSIKQNKPQ